MSNEKKNLAATYSESDYNKLVRRFKDSILKIEELDQDLIKDAIRFYRNDSTIIQGGKLFEFIEEETEREKEYGDNIVWIREEEWNFESEGYRYGMIHDYNRYQKNGEDCLLIKVLYSPDKIKLIKATLELNDVVTHGIIRAYGNRFDLDDILDQYVLFRVKNTVDDKGKIFSQIVSFGFLLDEEFDFVNEMYTKIQNELCDVQRTI